MGDDRRVGTGGQGEGADKEKLFAEWTGDYAARREENRREREGVSAAGPPGTWPSEIARANREKLTEQDRGKGGQEQSRGRDEGHSM